MIATQTLEPYCTVHIAMPGPHFRSGATMGEPGLIQSTFVSSCTETSRCRLGNHVVGRRSLKPSMGPLHPHCHFSPVLCIYLYHLTYINRYIYIYINYYWYIITIIISIILIIILIINTPRTITKVQQWIWILGTSQTSFLCKRSLYHCQVTHPAAPKGMRLRPLKCWKWMKSLPICNFNLKVPIHIYRYYQVPGIVGNA